MKCLLASALATLAGLGWLGIQTGSDPAAADDSACRARDCDVSIECLPDGTCRIECEGPEGPCWLVLDCDPDGECVVLDRGGVPCDLEDCEALPACAASRAKSAPACGGSCPKQ